MKKIYLSIAAITFLISSQLLLADEKVDNAELESVTIVEDSSSPYELEKKPSITRSNIRLENTSKSVQVFNENFIEDLQAQSITSIVEMASNTVYQGDSHGRVNNFSIRGFSSVPVLIDGFNLDNAIAYPEVYNFERIEVLKGPDSLQYGESSPGGLINLVKKKPDQKDTKGEISLEVSSTGSLTPKLDIAGSLNDDGSLRYRLVSTYEYDDGVKDYNFNSKKIFIAPSVAYDINDNHTITFMAEYLNEDTFSEFGTFIDSNGSIVTSTEVVTSHPDAKTYNDQKLIGFDLDSTLDMWNTSLRYRYVESTYEMPGTNMPFFYDESTNSIGQVYSTQISDSNEHDLDFTLNKKINNHNLTFGLEAKRIHSITEGSVDYAQYIAYATSNYSGVYTLDLDDIDYSNLESTGALYKYADSDTITKKYGIFVQDNIELTDNLIINLGLRHSKISQDETENLDATLPQFGLVYKFTPKTSMYVSYSQSFEYQTSTDTNGNILDPEVGEGFELGIKQKLFNDNFDLTAAIFKIEKDNVAMSDPDDLTAYISSGKQVSKGIEFDLVGDIKPGWSLIASYGYTNTEDKGNYSGNQLAGVPKHTVNLYTNYNLASFSFPSISLGGGIKFLGSRYADSSNTVKLDSAFIYNATLGYKKGNWKANLGIQNITDEVYAETSTTARAYVGAPRTVLLSVGYSF